MNSYLQFVWGNKYMLSFGCLCVFWGNFGQSFYLGWFGDAIMQSLGMSATDYGTTYSLATLASGLTIMWVGGFIDHWSLKKFVSLVALGFVLACVVLSQANSLWLLALGFYLVRLFGQGLLPHTGSTTMAKVFDANRGKALSVSSSGLPLGEVLLPGVAVFLIATFGWQTSWLVVAGATVLIFLPKAFALLTLSHRALPDLSVHIQPSKVKKAGRAVVLKDARFWLAAPTLLFCPFMLTGIFVQQGFILDEKAWSAEWLATCFTLFGITHWLSALTFGILVDRFSAASLLRFYMLPLVLATLCLANLEGYWVAPLVMVCIGVANGASNPVVGSLWAEVYGTAVLGGVRSAVSSVIILSTAVSPILFGWLIDADVSLFALMNGCAIFFSVGMLLLNFSYPARRA